MKIVILQSNYIPWKGYFDLIHDADVFVFYDCVKYTKNDWRNRNQIYTRNGKQWLTVPISLKATSLAIDEVPINEHKWQDNHFKSLYFGYKSAPHFSDLEAFADDLYKQHEWNNLSALNQYSIKKIAAAIGITTRFVDARELTIEEDRVGRLISIIKQLGGTEYISGMAAKDYLTGKEHLFEESGIKLTWKVYPDYQPYQQLGSAFDHYVSIVDLIANIGWANMKKYIYE